MISVQNLTKTYKFSKNSYVKALDNISLNFEDKGLVFVLGKSGSGKTTLLNMLGTLDTYDSGNILINGKSIKDLSQRELDSYRNSLMGFIFQEHNLMDYLTIEKNISIALELQGAKCDKDAINRILESVDLAGYGNRMPNELSTGEKQRVAIARALIKSPKFILADEPTGSLDSETGKLVMDILKKISQNRLVIVITHNLELAYQYGERIIEIADGRLINDTMNNQDVELESNKSDLLLKKTKLPFFYSLKIALNNFKRRPFRLLLSIILSAIAFISFAIFDNLGHYDQKKTTLISMYKFDVDYISLTKTKFEQDPNGPAIFMRDLLMSDSDINMLIKNFSKYSFIPVLKQNSGSFRESLFLEEKSVNSGVCFNQDITGSVEITQELIDAYNLKMIAGILPKKNLEENEIVITKYVYEQFAKFGYKDLNGSLVSIDKPDDLIGKSIQIDEESYIVSGIVDTNLNNERYNYCLNNIEEDLSYAATRGYTYEELQTILDYDLHTIIFVREGYYNEVVKTNTQDITTNEGNYLRVFTLLKKNYYDDIKLVDFSFDMKNNERYMINNEVTATIDIVDSRMDEIVDYLLYVGIGFAVFASLILFNFISESVLLKKRDIGILRALGASIKDVLLIFINESLLIAIINTVLAVIGTFISMIIINHQIVNKYELLIKFADIGFRQIGLVLIISIFVAMISSIIPIMSFRREKPIDIIKLL